MMLRRLAVYFWVLVGLGLGLTGCAFKKFAYDHADWFAMRKVNQFFDPTAAQKKKLEPQVKVYITWVKRSEAPKAIQLLGDIHQELADGISAEDYDKIWSRYVSLRTTLIQKLAKPAAGFLRSLDEEQITHLREELAESNERYEELSKAQASKFKDKLQKRADRQIEFYEDLLGDLTPEQKQIILAGQDQTQADVRRHLELREQVQANFITAIRTASSDAALAKLIRKWAAQPGTMGTDKAYQALLDERDAKRKQMIVQLDKSLSKDQRQHALKKLANWLAEFQEIVGY